MQQPAEGGELEKAIGDEECDHGTQKSSDGVVEKDRADGEEAQRQTQQDQDVERLERDRRILYPDANDSQQRGNKRRQVCHHSIGRHTLPQVIARRHQPLPKIAPSTDGGDGRDEADARCNS